MPRYMSYAVRGGFFPFPVDMLRYDGSFPATTEDAIEMARAINREWDPDVRSRMETKAIPERTIHLICVAPVKGALYGAPTRDRWASFGWKVVEG